MTKEYNLTDALDRRTSLALVAKGQAVERSRQVAERMAPDLGWDATEVDRQVEQYAAHVAIVATDVIPKAAQPRANGPGSSMRAYPRASASGVAATFHQNKPSFLSTT